VRDFVLGVRLLDGQGRILSFGGQVMKNVAGYDVSRLVTGSLGTLGVIVEASLKVLPRPPLEASLEFEMPRERALQALQRWAGQPLPISASAWHDERLRVRLSGAQAAVGAAIGRLGGERIDNDDAARFWSEVREHRAPFFAGAAPLWRLALPGGAKGLEVPGAQFIEWSGALRWLKSGADASAIRGAAIAAGGHATLFRGGDKSAGVFTPLDPVMARLHRELKRAFDPSGILGPGRLYAEF